MAVSAWLTAQLDLTAPVAPLVPGILTDACLIGGVSASAMTEGASPDPGGWEPGDTDAARARIEALGLGAALGLALASADDTAGQMAGSYTASLSRLLIDGAAAGLTAASIGASLTGYASDPRNAHGSVLGMLVKGIGAAAMALYQLLKVDYGRWVVDPSSNVCPVCQGNASAGRRRIGSAYPSGDTESPAHDRCRCQVIPD